MNQLVKNKGIHGIRAKVAGACAGLSVAMHSAVLAYAASSDPFANATTVIEDIFGYLQTALTTVVVPIAACALVFCLIMMLVSQNQKKVEAYRGWAMTIFFCVIGIFAVNFIVGLAEQIGKAF